MKPYLDIKPSKSFFIRVFFPWASEKDIVWHRDKCNREVKVLLNSGWEFQHDNSLPFSLKGNLFIEKEKYHRLIKGNGLLLLKIKEQ
jgi:hypothetical protein